MKKDPYKHKEKYLAWKERIKKIGYIEGISRENSDLIIKYILDIELGINVSKKSAKGARSHIRLNNLKQRMIFMSKRFEEYYKTNCLTNLTENQIIKDIFNLSNPNGVVLAGSGGGKSYFSKLLITRYLLNKTSLHTSSYNSAPSSS